MSAYVAPLDKMRCIAACCTHLERMLPSHTASFVRLFALCFLAARPPQLHSQLEYVVRFVHPDKLWSAEFGGPLSIARAAVQWLAIQDPATLQNKLS